MKALLFVAGYIAVWFFAGVAIQIIFHLNA